MDGEIDYAKLSRAQLEEALTLIDGGKYPRNLENLKRELAARPQETPSIVPRESIISIFAGYFLALACLWLTIWFLIFMPIALFVGRDNAFNHAYLPIGANGVATFFVYLHLARHHFPRFLGVACCLAVSFAVIVGLFERSLVTLTSLLGVNIVAGSLAGSLVSTRRSNAG